MPKITAFDSDENAFWLASDEQEDASRFDRSMREKYRTTQYDHDVRSPADIIPELLMAGVFSDWHAFTEHTGLDDVLSAQQRAQLLAGTQQPAGTLLTYLVNWLPSTVRPNIGALILNREPGIPSLDLKPGQSAQLQQPNPTVSTGPVSGMHAPKQIPIDWSTNTHLPHTPYRTMLNAMVAAKTEELASIAAKQQVSAPTAADIRRKVARLLNVDVWGLEGFMPLAKPTSGWRRLGRVSYYKSALYFAQGAYDVLCGVNVAQPVVAKESFLAAAVEHFSDVDALLIEEAQTHGTPKYIGGVIRSLSVATSTSLTKIANSIPYLAVHRATKIDTTLKHKFYSETPFSASDIQLIAETLRADETTLRYLQNLNTSTPDSRSFTSRADEQHWLTAKDTAIIVKTPPTAPLETRIQKLRAAAQRMLKKARSAPADTQLDELERAKQLFQSLNWLQEGFVPEITPRKLANGEGIPTTGFWVRNRAFALEAPKEYATVAPTKAMRVLTHLCFPDTADCREAEQMLFVDRGRVVAKSSPIQTLNQNYSSETATALSSYISEWHVEEILNKTEQLVAQLAEHQMTLDQNETKEILNSPKTKPSATQKNQPATDHIEEISDKREQLAALRAELRAALYQSRNKPSHTPQKIYAACIKNHFPKLGITARNISPDHPGSLLDVAVALCHADSIDRWEARALLCTHLPIPKPTASLPEFLTAANGSMPETSTVDTRNAALFLKRSQLSWDALANAIGQNGWQLRIETETKQQFPPQHATAIADALGIPDAEQPLFIAMYCQPERTLGIHTGRNR